MSTKPLQDYVFTSKYSRYIPKLKRRETYDEAVDRVLAMHADFFAGKGIEIGDLLATCSDAMHAKMVLGSQRAMQFGGPAVIKVNARIFNCSAAYCDRARFFQESLWLLLCGCGVGMSVQRHHVAKLPPIAKPDGDEVTYAIPDSIEGWSDALGVLLSSYFTSGQPFPEYAGKRVAFDYSLIRPRGATISSGMGKAPGPDPLHRSLELIRELLNGCVAKGMEKLRPLDAYDIIMHASDAVLSGGVRRSACLCMFSPDDNEMATAKTGNWFSENPQRARSNNSALLLRGKTTKRQFSNLMKSVKEFGEPGFVWADDTEATYNPCFAAGTRLATSAGLPAIETQKGLRQTVATDNRVLSSGNGYCFYGDGGVNMRDASDVMLTQSNAQLWRVTTSHGYAVEATAGHEFQTLRGKIPLRHLLVGDSLMIQSGEGEFGTFGSYDQGVCLGFASVGLDEQAEAYRHEIDDADLIETLAIGVEGRVPEEVFGGSRDFVLGYLWGVMAACDMQPRVCHGCRSAGIVLQTSNREFMADLQILLANLGVVSYLGESEIEIRDSSAVELIRKVDRDNHLVYTLQDFMDVEAELPKEQFVTTITAIEKSSIGDVYCLCEPTTNSVIANGLVTGQCVEIGLYPQVDGQSGFAFCNLCEINMGVVDSAEKFEKAARAAAILGTLQAAYTSFPYLGDVSERIAREESLLGVSMTGMMEHPEISFNPDLQRKMAYLILDVNRYVAARIGINACARATCVKPAGCLHHGQKVRTTDGIKTILEIFEEQGYTREYLETVTDVWLTLKTPVSIYNENNEVESVWKLYVCGMNKVVEIPMEDGTVVRTTPWHKFKLANDDWRRADEIAGGDRLANGDGGWFTVSDCPVIDPLAKHLTLDMETARTHTYQLDNGLVTHNSTSAILGTSSGIHPHHARRYFRRAQTNRDEKLAIYFQKHNPKSVEQSVWNKSGSDMVITFCIEAQDKALTKGQMTALDLLEKVRLTKENWIDAGKCAERCAQPWLSHNVSNTINVRDDEWQAVEDYIFEHRHSFAGIALLPDGGDLDYPQAPFCEVLNAREIVDTYGVGAIMSSGLIVDALHVFGDNLWEACDCVLGRNGDLTIATERADGMAESEFAMLEERRLAKLDWIRRARKFAGNYFGGDELKMTRCLKRVHNCKLWEDLRRETKVVDYTKMVEKTDNTTLIETVACAGGACSIL
jgi:hypothetical protein